MVKKMISGFLALLLILCAFSPAAYADDEHQHTFGEVTDTVDTKGLKLPNGQDFPVNVSITKSPCSTPGISCGKVLYSWNFGGRGGSFVDDKDLPVAEVIKRWYEWNERFYGNNVGFTQFQAGGGSASPGGVGRFPKGYQNETGVPSVNSTGVLCMVVEPFGIADSNAYNFHKSAPNYCVTGSSGSGTEWPFYDKYTLQYYFTAPVSGLYFIGSYGNPYDYGSLSIFYNNEWVMQYYNGSFTTSNVTSISLKKGETCYLGLYVTFKSYGDKIYHRPYKFTLNKIPIFIEPLGDSSITQTTNITINNNTWNGNIYTDNSTNLTYIYPQYTTINENNETVTNISSNPIIYNEETKQYYTYDSVTNDYYYITYGDPAPTPTPSPSPDPGGSAPDPDNPSPSPSPSTSPGGSSDKETGGNSFFNFIFGFGSDTGKDENGKKGIIWSLISLLVSCVTFVVGMGTAYSYLFPFLPPGLCTTIHICVLVLFLFAVIKFIRSFI